MPSPTLDRPIPAGSWFQSLAQPAPEFSPTPLPILEGSIPIGVRGTLYRNGPARLERGGQKMGHWFDGDGAILAVRFQDQGATGVYRYVQTEGYRAEAEADRLLYGNYGMTAPGPIWNQWQRPLKNSANTSVLPLADRVLALWEGGHPHALHPDTLETIGLEDLAGLQATDPYSAHGKQDPQTGEIFNFGILPGAAGVLTLYRSDATGRILQRASALQLDGYPVIHDFVLAGPYLVFVVPSVRLNPLPVVVGFGNFSESLQWRPDKPTEILVFDRQTLKLISRSTAEPWFQWHFGNGYVDQDGLITFDMVRFADFQTNEYLREVPTGQMRTRTQGTLWRVRLDPQTAAVKVLEQVYDQSCEFPTVDPRQTGQFWRYTYLLVHRPGVDPLQEMFGAIGRYDSATRELIRADTGPNHYPMEPLYIPDAQNPEQGWIITVVYDGDRHASEVWIYDADRLTEAPVCRLGLPSVIPLGFHGKWHPR